MELNVALVQPDLFWEKIDDNLSKISELIGTINLQTDVIILPELFSTGFTMNTSNLAEEMSGTSLEWMKNMAKSMNACIIGSLMIGENGKFYNRLLAVLPSGHFKIYDKRHLFRMGGEHVHYSSGTSKLIFRLNGWEISPLICYDLRFPVWSRNLNDYDLLIYIANWPSSRRLVWNTLMKARAIENQCYVIGVNRTGVDGAGIKYSGESKVIDFKGNTILNLARVSNCCKTVTLNLDKLKDFRKKFPVYLDADNFNMIM